MARSSTLVILLGLLIACAAQWGQVQSEENFQELQDGTFGSTDPITFKFGAQADDSLAQEDTFTTEGSNDAESTVDESNADEFSSSFGSETEDMTTMSLESAESPEYVEDAVDEPESSGAELYAPVQEDDQPVADDDDAAVIGDSNGSASISSSTADALGFDWYENDDDNSTSTSNSDGDEVGAASFASRYSCATGNPVDDCWRCDPNWASNRQRLASCAVGFGRGATGGKNGRVYVVTSSRDDNPASPARGTLRYAVTRPGPLWITFAYSMTIKLKNELLITSYKTIDGRGVTVRIAGGGGLTLQRVSNVIIHGIAIHDIKPTGPGRIMSSTSHVGQRGRCDGDAISVFASKNVWIDHCYLARAADGLIDVIRGSTAVSITNNYFTQHDKVMLLGAHKNDYMDRTMFVTVAYNTFGPGLTQRMPRVRFGSVHVVNNDYTSGWKMYAIAGSESPTILSQGNVFNANRGSKQVTKRINDGGQTFGGPKNWNWRSEGDQFVGGAFFTSVPMKWSSHSYAKTASCSARPAAMVVRMCRGAGPLKCRRGARC